MQKNTFTRYQADQLVEARKIATKTFRNSLFTSDLRISTRELAVALRRKDSPTIDLVLAFGATVKTAELSGIKSGLRPSASLLWHGKRIRGLDYTIKHDVVESGISVGVIRGWHEHYWTDSDQDNSIREPNPPIKNMDISAILEWSLKQWNIEGIGLNKELFR